MVTPAPRCVAAAWNCYWSTYFDARTYRRIPYRITSPRPQLGELPGPGAALG
ncbi:MAG: hypothetical protein JO287_15830 [Pseudonocardiales bacterium]|nr:hypothetical protein [Pseudonocardiales bacterium]